MGSRWMRNSFVYLMILVAVIAIVVIFFRPGADLHPKSGSMIAHREQKLPATRPSMGSHLSLLRAEYG